ncbi:hypothetical protein [Flammeovirga sp. SJP92]|uniref:hypothetical protein n=1 Tax=Flammeovirga sp. SJP92 TaxID=1775430 RepID=UPI0007879591|nr:hypothetical protein [Flammeovirga sp. SJP92]KXX67585.1 hypothetical protein AVL50_26355 [Flammeovirga sp. SJP92]
MKLRNIGIGIALLSVMVACNDMDNGSTTDAQFSALEEASTEASGLSVNLEVQDYTDNVTDDAMERGLSLETSSNARSVGEGEEGRPKKGKGECGKRFHLRHYVECADVTKTEEGDTKTVVFDFSNGACESKDGETVSGKVTEVHTRVEGEVSHSTTFEDFTENGRVVNGTTSMEGTIVFEEGTEENDKPKPVSSDISKSVNLSLSFAATDTTEAYTEQIVRNVDVETIDGTKTVTGSLTVTSSLEGESFTTEITEPLSYVKDCGGDKPVLAPVSGIEVMTKGESTITVNYGDGTCDYLVEITLSDGTTETVDLKEAYDEYGFKGVKKLKRRKK